MSTPETVVTTIYAGTSGFRGKTFEDIRLEHARVIGVRYGEWLRKQGHSRPTVTVGHDQRHGARELANAVISGLMQEGANAVSLDMGPTGLFTFAMKKMRHDGGILVTGSHMKPDRIGIIPINPDGTYCTSEVTDFISEGFHDYDAIMRVDPIRGGTCSSADMGKLTDAYCADLIASVNADAIRTAQFNIVFDAGNGTMGPVAMRVFDMLGIEATGLFIEPKEQPDRESECVPENCGAAIVLTSSTTTLFDLGIAVDGDGDRGMFISPATAALGTALDGDVVAGVFLKEALEMNPLDTSKQYPCDFCITPVTSGSLTAHLCEEAGVTVRYCRVGQPDTGRAVKEHGATFYHEAASNKFGFRRFSLGYDALYTLLKMLEIMARRRMLLDELVAELPVFYRKDVKVEFKGLEPEFCRVAAKLALAEAMEAFAGKGITVNETDGLRFDFNEGSWVLLRPSGTEPLARVYGGGQNLGHVKLLVGMAVDIFRRHLGLAEPA